MKSGLFTLETLVLGCDVETHQVEMEANWTEQFSSLQSLIPISSLPSVKTANQPDLIPAKRICIFICSYSKGLLTCKVRDLEWHSVSCCFDKIDEAFELTGAGENLVCPSLSGSTRDEM